MALRVQGVLSVLVLSVPLTVLAPGFKTVCHLLGAQQIIH